MSEQQVTITFGAAKVGELEKLREEVQTMRKETSEILQYLERRISDIDVRLIRLQGDGK